MVLFPRTSADVQTAFAGRSRTSFDFTGRPETSGGGLGRQQLDDGSDSAPAATDPKRHSVRLQGSNPGGARTRPPPPARSVRSSSTKRPAVGLVQGDINHPIQSRPDSSWRRLAAKVVMVDPERLVAAQEGWPCPSSPHSRAGPLPSPRFGGAGKISPLAQEIQQESAPERRVAVVHMGPSPSASGMSTARFTPCREGRAPRGCVYQRPQLARCGAAPHRLGPCHARSLP